MLTSLLSAKAVVTAATAAVALGGAATAAYAGDLPASAQKLAHAAIGAPSPKVSHGAGSASAGPNATGPAAFGLCNAYSHAKAHGSARQKAVAFRHLAAAAGGANNIDAYCAAVPQPGRSHSSRKGSTRSHPAGQPSSLPTAHSSGHPSSAPVTHPTGKPTAVPTPK